MAKVTFSNLSFSFGQHRIFKDFSLTVNDGEILGIVGPSGCGKTTLIRCLAGLLQPEQGEITIGERVLFSKREKINIAPEKRNIGMVFQDYAVWPHKTVWQNIEYPLVKRKVNKNERADKINYALNQVRMQGYEQHLPVQLSGGQQQRVAIARALVANNDLIILDEPITNLDAKLREEMIVEIKLIQKETGATIIYITHDQEAALQLCDRIAIMQQDGSIAQLGNDEDIINEPANRFVYEFIGVSEFLQVRKQGTYLQILSKESDQYLLPLPAGSTATLQDGQCYDMGIRPADIILHEVAGDSKDQLTATIVSSVFLGNQYNYFVRLGEHNLRVQRSTLDVLASRDYHEGETVALEILRARFYPCTAAGDNGAATEAQAAYTQVEGR